jgi:hypothetical protein
MHLFALLFIAFTALSLAQNTCTGDKSIVGHCTILSITDSTTKSSQSTVTECLDTCHGISMDAGDWIVDFTGQPAGYVDHLSQAACSFSIGRGEGMPLDYQFYMHNQDILDIIVSLLD